MKFSERLKSLRKEKKLTQSALAEKSGVSLNTIFSFESGRRENPTSETISKLAAALEVDPGELVAGWPGLKIIDRENPVAPKAGSNVPSASVDELLSEEQKENVHYIRTTKAFFSVGYEEQRYIARATEAIAEEYQRLKQPPEGK